MNTSDKGAEFIKGVVFSTFLALAKIPLGILGAWLIARQWTDAENWAIAQYGLGTLGCCWLWATISVTDKVRRMSGVIAKEDVSLLVDIAHKTNPDAPRSEIIEEFKEAKAEQKAKG